MKKIRKRVNEIVEIAKEKDLFSKIFDIFIVVLIALNVLVLALETMDSVYQIAPSFFVWFETISVLVFTIEYVSRIWSCVEIRKYKKPVRGRLSYALRPMPLIDLIAVLPFYLPFLGVDLRFIRSIRMFRLFRIAKVARYSKAIKTIGNVIRSKRAELMITLFILVLILIISSSMMYFAEHETQPKKFPSIPASLWWSVATLTTVGYGDVYPVTVFGKIIGCIIAITGIGMFALPTGILGAAFVEEIRKDRTDGVCPHCNKKIVPDQQIKS